MSFNEDVQLDPERASSGGPGAGVAIGGGAIGVIALLIALFTGDTTLLNSVSKNPATQSQSQSGTSFEHCTTGRAANQYVDCRIIGTAQSLDAVWGKILPEAIGARYQKPNLKLFKGSVNTGCGRATSAVGPFYCPADRTAYFDTDFFSTLEKLGSSGGALAQEYVVAHEFGHHIQNQLNILDRAQRDPRGPESGAVRTELMADCLGGVWAHHASTTRGAGGQPFLKPLTDKDISDALSAAAAVGDDRIQKKTQGRVNPEGWTHGSSEQRQKWFLTGYQSGNPNSCDTFSSDI